MKNDFDFIKDRIDNSGINAPAHMDESFVHDRIDGIRPQVVPIEAAPAQHAQHAKQTKKRRTGRITAIAAAVVAVAVLGTALTVHFTRNKAADPLQPAGEVSQTNGLIRFSSYDEVHAAVDQLRSHTAQYTNEYDTVDEEGEVKGIGMPAGIDDKVGTSASPDRADGALNGSDDHSETYKQVEGVDEADVIKTDGRYIYVAEGVWLNDRYSSRVSVFQAKSGVTEPFRYIVPGESYSKEPPASTGDEATPDESDEPQTIGTADGGSVIDMYLVDDRLVILCRFGGYAVDYGYARGGSYYAAENKTRAYVYDVADMDHVRLLDTFTQSGSYTSSRMIGDTLYLVTNEYDLDDIPVCGRGDDPAQVNADCIYSVEDPSISSFLIVSAYDTGDKTSTTDSKAVLGLGSDVYCSTDNLYISAADYSGYYMDYVLEYSPEFKDGDDAVITYGADGSASDGKAEVFTPKTKIFKVSLSDGVNFTAYGEIEGRTNDQYSFDEYNGYLRVAATSNNSDYEDINNLYVLDGDLDIVGSVTGFAETESIKAVRYVGNTAYVITYEQTDPLFVIDLSLPTAPAILGEVKISGFSTMLVPIDENTILGLGVNTGEADYTDLEVQNGFKLALFDVSDKSSPKVLDSKSYVNFSSQVMYNPKALVYNPGRGDYLVPLDYYYYDDSDEYESYGDDDYDAWQSFYDAHTEQYGAVLNFRVEGGSIVVTDLHVTEYDSISRCVYVGDTVFVIRFDDSGAAHLDSFSYI